MLRLISLGGTIACLPDTSGGGVAPALSGAQMLAAVPQAAALGPIEASNLSNLPSTEITFALIRRLVEAITSAEAEGARGVVVTQGTDTIEETAFMLSLLYGGDMPVVVTGAMRNASLPGADGPANLLAALRVIANPDAGRRGVMVVFDDMIHAGLWVQKTDTSATGAFVSAYPLGRLVEDRPRFFASAKRLAPIGPLSGETPFVPILKPGLDDQPRLVDAALAAGAAALVVELAGGGHVQSNWLDPLADAAARIPVIYASRTRAGRVLEATYSQIGGEIDLRKRGLIGSGDLDAIKARLLLMVFAMAQKPMSDFAEYSKFDV